MQKISGMAITMAALEGKKNTNQPGAQAKLLLQAPDQSINCPLCPLRTRSSTEIQNIDCFPLLQQWVCLKDWNENNLHFLSPREKAVLQLQLSL